MGKEKEKEVVKAVSPSVLSTISLRKLQYDIVRPKPPRGPSPGYATLDGYDGMQSPIRTRGRLVQFLTAQER